MKWGEGRDDGHRRVVAAGRDEGQVQDRGQRFGLRPIMADQAILAVANAETFFRLVSYRGAVVWKQRRRRGRLARKVASRLLAVEGMVATGQQVQRLT